MSFRIELHVIRAHDDVAVDDIAAQAAAGELYVVSSSADLQRISATGPGVGGAADGGCTGVVDGDGDAGEAFAGCVEMIWGDLVVVENTGEECVASARSEVHVVDQGSDGSCRIVFGQ